MTRRVNVNGFRKCLKVGVFEYSAVIGCLLFEVLNLGSITPVQVIGVRCTIVMFCYAWNVMANRTPHDDVTQLVVLFSKLNQNFTGYSDAISTSFCHEKQIIYWVTQRVNRLKKKTLVVSCDVPFHFVCFQTFPHKRCNQ